MSKITRANYGYDDLTRECRLRELYECVREKGVRGMVRTLCEVALAERINVAALDASELCEMAEGFNLDTYVETEVAMESASDSEDLDDNEVRCVDVIEKLKGAAEETQDVVSVSGSESYEEPEESSDDAVITQKFKPKKKPRKEWLKVPCSSFSSDTPWPRAWR